jgi:hypothetical protein
MVTGISPRPRTPVTGPVRKKEAVHIEPCWVLSPLWMIRDSMKEKGALAEKGSVDCDARESVARNYDNK